MIDQDQKFYMIFIIKKTFHLTGGTHDIQMVYYQNSLSEVKTGSGTQEQLVILLVYKNNDRISIGYCKFAFKRELFKAWYPPASRAGDHSDSEA